MAPPRSAPALSKPTLALGNELAAALLGLDALYRRESGDATGLVVVRLRGADRVLASEFGSYDDARQHLRDLHARTPGLPEPDRRAYYEDVCASSLAFCDWRSDGLGLEDQLAGFLHVPAAPAAPEALEGLRRAMGALLEDMGYAGKLEARLEAWEDRHRVSPEEVAPVLTRLLDEAWDRTCDRVCPVPAEKADAMRVATVRDVSYNARCDYVGRTVEINVDPVLTLPGLRHLAVHEGLPGHYLQFKLRELAVEEGRAPADGLLSVVNTASSCVFEGIADTGLAMLGWDEAPDDRVQGLLTRYRAAIGTAAAWMLHGEGQSRDAVADWLRSKALTGGEGWVQNRLGFIEAEA
ncbi:MAG: hypothetical protein OEO23_16440, partial [Gemmatimonadota bacterium]|nr:hypothetical protein [Gemmatimonadota bacterium]